MKNLIIVRGGGDLATGSVYKLKKSGFPVLILEVANPSAIRRNVAFCEAVYQGTQTVEDMTCYLANSLEQAEAFLREGKLTVLVDPVGDAISKLKPLAVVDAILAKKNLGTNRDMAPLLLPLARDLPPGAMWMPLWRPSAATTWEEFFGPAVLRPIPASPVSLADTVKSG